MSTKKRRRKGTGTIYRKGDRWLAAITLDGRERSKRFDTYEEAEQWLDQLLQAHNGTGPVPLADRTVDYYLDEHLKRKAATEEVSQRKAEYEMVPLRELLGTRIIASITPEDVRNFWAVINNQQAHPRQQHRSIPSLEEPLSERAVMRIRQHIRGAFDLALEDGAIKRNPTRVYKRTEPMPMPRERSQVKALSPGLTRQFLEVAEHDSLGLLFELFVSVGFRLGEALALTRHDIDLDAGTVSINKSLTDAADGIAIYGDPKTDCSNRTLPLSHDLVEKLDMHLQEQVESMAMLNLVLAHQELVFTNQHGAALTGTTVNRRLRKLLCPLLPPGHPKPSVKWLRATYASLAGRAGTRIEVISERMGHADVTYTFKKYRHLYSDEGHALVLSARDMIALGNRTIEAHDGDASAHIRAALMNAFGAPGTTEARTALALIESPDQLLNKFARNLGLSPSDLIQLIASGVTNGTVSGIDHSASLKAA